MNTRAVNLRRKEYKAPKCLVVLILYKFFKALMKFLTGETLHCGWFRNHLESLPHLLTLGPSLPTDFLPWPVLHGTILQCFQPI